MSETSPETLELDPSEKKVSMTRGNIDALEAKAARAAAAERELAFLKAGIDTDDAKLAYFVKGYDGDVDPTSIKAAALAAGFITEPDNGAAAAGAASERIQAAAAGQVPTASQNGADNRAVDYAEALREGGLQGLSVAVAKHGPVRGINV